MRMVALAAWVLLPLQAGAALVLSADGKTVYDTVNNITWLANANFAAAAPFGQPVNASGLMSYQAAAAWVSAMNTAGYLGQINWQLPTTPFIDSSCPFTGPNGISFGFTCSGSALGWLYYSGLALTAPSTAVPIPNNTVGPFSNFQPYLYWSQTANVQTGSGYNTFSFNSGFAGSNTIPNYLYVLPMIAGKAVGTPPAGSTVYDPVTNVTWLANANIAASNTFGLPLCKSQGNPKLCVSADGSMNWDSASQFVTNMNSGSGYLGQMNWELPPVDPNCGGYNCSNGSNPMAELFYGLLGLSQGTPVVTAPDVKVGPFHNIQPYLYWSCQGATIQSPCEAAGPASGFEWSFSFGNGFEGTDLLQNDLYATAYFPGSRSAAAPVISSVQDAESARTTLVPGEWAAIYGKNLAAPGAPCAGNAIRVWCSGDFPAGTAPGSPLPTSLDGTSVTFNGIAAAILYILPTQIAVQVPALASGPANVVVSNNGAMSAAFTATIVESAPSFYSIPLGSVTYPAAVHNFLPITYVGDPAVAGPAYQKAHPGETILMYINGLTAEPAGEVVRPGVDLSSQVTVMAGSTQLPVSYAGLVSAGEFQLNVTIPSSLAAGLYPLTVSYQGHVSPGGISLAIGP